MTEMAAKKKAAKKPGRLLTSHKLVVYLYDKAKRPKEEGTVFLCDKRGKIIQQNEDHFDDLDDLGAKVRGLLIGAGIKWP